MSETATETGTTTETGAPAGTETEETTETAAPAGAESTETTTDGAEDARVKRANSEAARYRTEKNALQQQVADLQAGQQSMLDKIAQALGLKPEDAADDPAVQVTNLSGQVETLTTENASLKAALLVHDLAPEAGANATALLDSHKFTTLLSGLDPAADDYRTKVAEAITAAVEQNATLKADGSQVQPSRGGAPEAGQGAGDEAGAVTAEQFKAMSYAERTALFRTNPALYRRLNAG